MHRPIPVSNTSVANRPALPMIDSQVVARHEENISPHGGEKKTYLALYFWVQVLLRTSYQHCGDAMKT